MIIKLSLDCVSIDLGNGVCNMDLNTEYCLYDYGDCCPEGADKCVEILEIGFEGTLRDLISVQDGYFPES